MGNSFITECSNTALSLIGILASAFIVVFYLLAWAKGRRLNTCDLILMSLGFESTFYQCAFVISKLLKLHRIHVDHRIDYLFGFFSGSTTVWFTACLCIFYCVKIVDFSNHLFVRLKMRISKMVPWMLLGSVMGSISLSITVYMSSYGESPTNSTTNLTSNSTVNNNALDMGKSIFCASAALGVCLPLALDVASIILILTSLCRHTQRMKNSASGFSQPQLQSHYRAAKHMGFILFTNILDLIVYVIILCSRNPLMLSVLEFIMNASITARPIILILGNPKLKQALWKILTPWRK